MKLNGVILSYEVEPGESLKGLVEEAGFSKPEKTDQGMSTSKSSYEFSEKVEVERIQDNIFVTVYPKDQKSYGKGINEIVSDLKKVGLLA